MGKITIVPLLSPSQIHQALKPQVLRKKSDKSGLSDLLNNASLSTEEVLENLSSLMRSGETDGVRLRAAETALKLNGLLNSDNAAPDFSVTINIVDSEFSVNPILIPR